MEKNETEIDLSTPAAKLRFCSFSRILTVALKHLLLKHDRKNKEDIILTDISPQISTH